MKEDIIFKNQHGYNVLRSLAASGMMGNYEENTFLRGLLHNELFRIGKDNFVEHYLLAYCIFKQYAETAGIEVWARGAMPSSLVCYNLGLTRIEPRHYGLHSSRFVNEEPPYFQFDIESDRYDEFMNSAEKIIEDYDNEIDTDAIKESLLGDVKPVDYLNKEHPRPIPDDIEDELACYALNLPGTQDLYDLYLRRKNGEPYQSTGIEPLDKILSPTYGILVYQEQMLDIIRRLLSNHGYRANRIRKVIQRGYSNEIADCRATVLQPDALLIDMADAETAWDVVTSNPRAFLKAHAVSRVLARYHYAF